MCFFLVCEFTGFARIQNISRKRSYERFTDKPVRIQVSIATSFSKSLMEPKYGSINENEVQTNRVQAFARQVELNAITITDKK